MKAKKVFKGPIIWIVLAAVFLMLIIPALTQGSSARVDTNVGLALLEDDREVYGPMGLAAS